MAMIRLIKRS